MIENPIGVMSTYFRKPDQIIQPWQFGDGYQKSTCLWFIGDVSELVVAVTVKPDLQYHTWTDPSEKLNGKRNGIITPGFKVKTEQKQHQ